MDTVQSLGLFGIYKESYNIITSWKKIFCQITLALIFPLSFILLAQMQISKRLFRNNHDDDQPYDHKKEPAYFLFNATYFTFLLIFSLLSTSAVVYTIASIYTNRDVTFKKVMKVVPKVWKRLMVTFLIIFVAFFVYTAGAVITIILGLAVGGNAVLLISLLILFAVGFVYMTIVWQLASAVTVLEDSYGVKAMKKSKDLIKGKFWVALAIFLKLNFLLLTVQVLFWYFVVYGGSLLSRIGFGILCFLLLVPLILIGLVIQAILYFVCKSYHNENIDKPALSKHLGEYERLNKDNDVQLEQV